jgi:hypothetical protein
MGFHSAAVPVQYRNGPFRLRLACAAAAAAGAAAALLPMPAPSPPAPPADPAPVLPPHTVYHRRFHCPSSPSLPYFLQAQFYPFFGTVSTTEAVTSRLASRTACWGAPFMFAGQLLRMLPGASCSFLYRCGHQLPCYCLSCFLQWWALLAHSASGPQPSSSPYGCGAACISTLAKPRFSWRASTSSPSCW